MARRKRVTAAWVVGLAAVVVVGGTAIVQRVATRHDRRALAALDAADPAERRRAAMTVAAEHAPAARGRIAASVLSEPDAGVREAYLYALGRAGTAAHFALAAKAAREDPSGFVRHRAWWAAARLDGERYRRLVAESTAADGWDAIGQAYGWLELGDVRGVAALLDWAVAGNADQRRAASQALYHGVAPLLVAAGRWPHDAEVGLNDAWPTALVEVVRARCAAVDLAGLAVASRAALARHADIRARVGKLDRARGRLARWLGVE